MSIGKLFARSRSTSPSRHSSSNERTDDDDDQTASVESCVPDPIFKVAIVNKHTENEFRGQYNPPPTLSHKSHSGPGAANDYFASTADKGYKPSRINTQPHYRQNSDLRNNPLSEIFVRDDHTFIDSFNAAPKQEEPFYGVGSTNYQDNSYRRPSYNHRHGGSISAANNFDAMLFQSSPELMTRPSSGGSNNSNNSSASSETDRTLSRGITVGDSISSNTSSIRSYFDENNVLSSPYSGGYRVSNSMSYDERLMSTIDGSRRSHSGSTSSRRAPLHPNFYSNPQMHQAPPLQHRAQTMPDMMTNHLSQFKNEVIGMFDDYVQSGQLPRSQKDMGHYYNNSYDGAQGFKTVSFITKHVIHMHYTDIFLFIASCVKD